MWKEASLRSTSYHLTTSAPTTVEIHTLLPSTEQGQGSHLPS